MFPQRFRSYSSYSAAKKLGDANGAGAESARPIIARDASERYEIFIVTVLGSGSKCPSEEFLNQVNQL
jgi:hypothetical protein